jgi:uncharacterized membrane protein YbhN (UPF0104 family)
MNASISPTSSTSPRDAPRPPGATTPGLLLAVLASPIAWIFDLGGRYFLGRTANQHDDPRLLFVVTALTLSVVVIGGFSCWRHWRRAARTPDPEGATPAHHARATAATLALWGLAFAAFFALLILANTFPAFVLGPRDLT